MPVISKSDLYRNRDEMSVLSAMFAHGKSERAIEIGSWLVPIGVTDTESWARKRLRVLERKGFVSSTEKGNQRFWHLTLEGCNAIERRVMSRSDKESVRSKNDRNLIGFRSAFRELLWV